MTKRTTYLGIMAALCFLMLALVPVSAESVSIKATNAQQFTMTIGTADVVFPLTTIGNNEMTTVNNVDVSTNSPLGFNVKVKDSMANSKPVGSDGKLSILNAGGSAFTGVSMANALKVSLNGGTQITLSGADQVLHSQSTAAAYSAPIRLAQTVTYNDPATIGLERYHVVLAITGSPNV